LDYPFLDDGYRCFLVWQKRNAIPIKTALILYLFQLILNAFWSVIFFGFRKPALAFFEIIVLWLLILFTLINFYKINKIAGFLLLPYLLWVSFAAILNLSIWLLN
jgi:tryptophan-rich sensory protein